MNVPVFDTWSSYITEILAAESQLAGELMKHPVERGSAREALIDGVLRRLLPGNYKIGTGEIVDSKGNRSRQMDIVVYRPDFPSLRLPGRSQVFLVESVLATIEVKSSLTKKTLFDAMDNCASIGELRPNFVQGAIAKIAKQYGMKKNAAGIYTHDDPLTNARFSMLGQPPAFVFGFKGYNKNYSELAKSISKWINYRNENKLSVNLRNMPAVIVSKGCFSWRNADPYMFQENILCGVGQDSTPLRLLILQLLYSINRRMPITPDVNQMVPNLDAYLGQMAPPRYKIGVGEAINV